MELTIMRAYLVTIQTYSNTRPSGFLTLKTCCIGCSDCAFPAASSQFISRDFGFGLCDCGSTRNCGTVCEIMKQWLRNECGLRRSVTTATFSSQVSMNNDSITQVFTPMSFARSSAGLQCSHT